VWGGLEAFFYEQLPTSQRILRQELSEVDSKHGRRGLDSRVSIKYQVIKGVNTLGRMYTPRNWEFRDISCSIPRSASRFVSIYLAGMAGRNISSADTYTNGRGILGSTPDEDSEPMNASHTRRADSCH